jgi:hypothetical protein
LLADWKKERGSEDEPPLVLLQASEIAREHKQ